MRLSVSFLSISVSDGMVPPTSIVFLAAIVVRPPSVAMLDTWDCVPMVLSFPTTASRSMVELAPSVGAVADLCALLEFQVLLYLGAVVDCTTVLGVGALVQHPRSTAYGPTHDVRSLSSFSPNLAWFHGSTLAADKSSSFAARREPARCRARRQSTARAPMHPSTSNPVRPILGQRLRETGRERQRR